MPIHGFRREDVQPRQMGDAKLKKGAPKAEGLQDLEFFRFDSTDAEMVAVFERIYGPEPRKFDRVYFPFNTMEENFSTWRELYGANGLCKVRCDGDTIVDWIEGNRHFHGERPCTKEFKDTRNRCPGCPLKPIGRLTLIFPELWEAGYVGYFVTLETHSWNDIGLITAKLLQYEPLTNKPFTLWREDTRIGVPIKDKRAAVEMSLVKLRLQDEWLMLEWQAGNRQAFEQIADVTEVDPAVVDAVPRDLGPDWEQYADREAELTEYDEPPFLGDERWENEPSTKGDFSGHPLDADAYEDLHAKPRTDLAGVGKDPAELVAQGKAAMAQEPTPLDAEAPERPPHWIDDAKTRAGFEAWLTKNGWTHDSAKAHFGIEHWHEYTGSLGQCKTALYNAER